MMYPCNASFQQSDQGGEWLNAVLRQLTKLLSIDTPFLIYLPRQNGSTERVHTWLNEAIGIDCENYEECWQEFLQPAIYAFSVAPIPGTSQMSPFFLVFGRNAPSSEMVTFALPVETIPKSIHAD